MLEARRACRGAELGSLGSLRENGSAREGLTHVWWCQSLFQDHVDVRGLREVLLARVKNTNILIRWGHVSRGLIEESCVSSSVLEEVMFIPSKPVRHSRRCHMEHSFDGRYAKVVAVLVLEKSRRLCTFSLITKYVSC